MKEKFRFIVIIIIFLLTLYFFSYRNLNGVILGRATQLASLALFCYCIFKYGTLKKQANRFASYKYVVFFYLYPLLTAVVCYIYHGQTIMQSFVALLPDWFISIYFLLIIFKIPPRKIVQLIVVCALIRTGLTLIEQFTYPNVPFAFRMDDYDEFNNFKEVEVRGGFYRYLISDAYFLPLFSAIYSLIKFTSNKSLKYLVIFLVSCFGIYMDQTRQILASLALCICLIPIIDSKNSKIKYFFIFVFLVGLVVSNFDLLFGESVSKTRDEVNESNIRVASYIYYFDNLGDIITSLFGNGLSYPKSSYGTEIANLQDFGLFTVDIGIVGALYILGYVFIAVFICYYLFVLIRKWRYIDSYLKVFLISVIVNIPLIFPLYNATLPCFECFMGMIFFLVDSSIQEHVIVNKKTSSNIANRIKLYQRI